MIEKVALVYDVHLEEDTSTIDQSYKVFKKFLAHWKPDKIVVGGDFMNCTAISHWIKDKKRKVEGKRWLKEVALANKELDDLQAICKKIVYLEGNHELWVETYLDKNPEMEGLIEIQEQLKLDKRGIEFYKYNQLYPICDNLYATHGVYTNKYHAIKHLTAFGCSLVYGHTHHPQTDMLNMKMIHPHKAWSLGCLCGHEPDYLRGRPANWMNGAGIVYVDTKTQKFNLYPIDIIDGTFISPEGKLFK